MSTGEYRFPPSQADYLAALQAGRCPAPARTDGLPRKVSLVDRMPPVYDQGLQGSCVSNAVTALLEYYGDCKVRLSVQFLYAATKEVEKAGVERNLARLRAGEPLDPPFETLYRSRLLQLRMLADANGGMASPAVRPYLENFCASVRARFDIDAGSLLRTCFKVAEEQGVCRYSFWPSPAVRATPVFGEGESVAFPVGAREDARKRRVVSGLYCLATPNNVTAIRGVLAGANGRRPMPVVVTASFFDGCDGATFTIPESRLDVDGRRVSVPARKGVHGLLVVGYEDDAAAPGGGWFIVRNSLGEGWGRRGYGRMPYAYLECFALEAGTILQDLVDYAGEGYAALPARKGFAAWPFWGRLLVNLLIGVVIATAAIAVWRVVHAARAQPPPPPPPVVQTHVDTPPEVVVPHRPARTAPPIRRGVRKGRNGNF